MHTSKIIFNRGFKTLLLLFKLKNILCKTRTIIIAKILLARFICVSNS